MPGTHEERLPATAAARAAFLEDGGPSAAGVRTLVAASWLRSRSAGVDADRYRITYHEDVDLDSRLVRCARPVIERMAGEMVDVPVAIALSDARARIVHRLDCSTAVGRPLDRVDFLAGFSFAEGGVGTNGIGTVFEAGAPVSVVGAEHFTEALVRFACTGAPVVDPVTGRVEGVLDVSSLAEDWTPLMSTVVRRAAADIGRALLRDRGQARQALFEAFARADSRPRQAVMAVGDSLVVNRRAQQLFDPAEQFAVHQHALAVMARRDRATDTLVLESGRRVRVRATRVLVGDDVAGLVLLLDEEADRPMVPVPRGAGDRPRPTPRARADRAGTAPPVLPAWARAAAEVAAAVERREPVLVLGEPGSGRRTLVAELFTRAHPAGPVVAVDAGSAVLDLPGSPAGPAPVLLLLTSLDRLDAAGAARVRELVGDLDRRWLVAGTADPAGLAAGRPLESVLAVFEQAVTVPPLRYRVDDLPRLTARLLADLAPDRRVRLSAGAARLVARHGWPGNLPQLREALSDALRRRPVGEIGPEDLPAWCRTAGSRPLTPIETAERDAIVAALHEHAGNRVHAAAALGVARSSLYRKIRAYAITEV
ncbi:sigma-54-dependent Fis family transcriptional regulator [Geodermatophilus marinus]|uniref:sigma-54-dependent Fis family transcriptional regulator n=1 Tax=Geodermatophilus sp. LHW52908 TaxID=2303986 RepID=UPI0018F53773|nr:helix-turn-helix domain-containing protein [Geodermatophilus sp. LHW52908]